MKFTIVEEKRVRHGIFERATVVTTVLTVKVDDTEFVYDDITVSNVWDYDVVEGVFHELVHLANKNKGTKYSYTIDGDRREHLK